MYARKVALLPCIMQNEYSFLRFGYMVQYKKHFWQKWNTVLNKDGNLLVVSERAANTAIRELRNTNYITLGSNEQRN
jgi:hypothetical protein